MPNRKNWRDSTYWRWWWRDGVSVEAVRRPSFLARAVKVGLALLAAGVLVTGGIISAELLSSDGSSQTITVTGLSTVGAATRADGFSQDADALTPRAATHPARVAGNVVTMFVTTTLPAQTQIVTVRRDRRGRVIRKGGRTVTQRVTVPGPLRERVITRGGVETVVRAETQTQTRTTDRLVTVTTPAATETVSRSVTQPSQTVTQTNTLTVHEPAHIVTVTRPVTVTNEVTVTVTETVKK